MFVCGKGHPLLLVINEYTKDLNIMVKITEEKTIYLHHEMWAVWINISGKSENISCFKTQAFFFLVVIQGVPVTRIHTEKGSSDFPPALSGIHIS